MLVVRSQGVKAYTAGKMDCQAAMSVVVYWCFNALIADGMADCKSCLFRWLRGRKAVVDAGPAEGAGITVAVGPPVSVPAAPAQIPAGAI